MAHQHCPLCGDGKDLQPGYIFRPNDKQLIDPYLHYFARTGEGCCKHIFVEKVYKKEPSELLGDDCDERYFFTTRTKCRTKRTPTSTRNSRTVGPEGRYGTWASREKKKEINSDDGEIMGFKTALYHKAGYIMYEYELPQSVPSSSSDKEEGAPLQERVLCCVKESPQKKSEDKKNSEDKKRKADAAAEAARKRADVVTAPESITVSPANAALVIGVAAGADCSAGPSQIYGADCSATLPMHSFAAAEASPEGTAHTEATNVASGNQIMPSSAAMKQQLPPCSSSNWTVPPANAAVVIGVTAGNCSARPLQISGVDCPPMDSFAAAEASPEGRAHTEATNLTNGNQMLLSSAADQQLLPCSSSCLTEEEISTWTEEISTWMEEEIDAIFLEETNAIYHLCFGLIYLCRVGEATQRGSSRCILKGTSQCSTASVQRLCQP